MEHVDLISDKRDETVASGERLRTCVPVGERTLMRILLVICRKVDETDSFTEMGMK